MTTQNNTKYYWFGDSWVAGDELEFQVDSTQVKNHTFAGLVSQHAGAEMINLSACGSGVNYMLTEFARCKDQIDPANDLVFFCLPPSHRNGTFDELGNFLNILPSGYSKHRPHPHTKEWYKYFDNPYQRLYNYDLTTNLLYLWCKQLNISAYFLNIFTTEAESLISCIPDSSWLIPRDRCLAEFILNIIDNQYGAVIVDDNPDLTNKDWAVQSELVNRYIHPLFCHPNVEGHKKIAEELIKLL